MPELDLLSILRSDEDQLLADLGETLEHLGYETQTGTFTSDDRDPVFVYGEGEIPLLLVAHADIAHLSPPSAPYVRQGCVFSREGLGADDRAGVFAVLRALGAGYRPHVLFTLGEEQGGIGAQVATEVMTPPDVRFIVQIDRRGCREAVFYNLDLATVPEARSYVEAHGFCERQGSFSDISWLCPAWGIAGANISAGYYNEHSSYEFLNLSHLKVTIDALMAMCETPPAEAIPYVEMELQFERFGFGSSIGLLEAEERGYFTFPCEECGKYGSEWDGTYDAYLCDLCFYAYIYEERAIEGDG